MDKDKKGADLVNILPLKEEPWIYLANGHDLSGWDKDREIAYNQPNRQMRKYAMFVETLDFLTENRVLGDYHEFGCHRCRTFRMALTEACRHALDNMKFWAFDSFEGLPETSGDTSIETWTQGALATSEESFNSMVEKHGIYVDRVTSVKGFYDQSLTPKLQKEFIQNENKISMVTVDCDFYESAVPVFNFIEPLLQEGSVIYIDDLFCGYKGSPAKGVARAFLEFQKQTKWKFIRHLDVGWWGRTYICYRDESSIDGVL